jgi:hypothetical protein
VGLRGGLGALEKGSASWPGGNSNDDDDDDDKNKKLGM